MIRRIVSCNRASGGEDRTPPAGGYFRRGKWAMAVLLGLAGPAQAGPDGATIYADLCASCHAETRLGGTGPALIPESLGRLQGDRLQAVIAEGRAMTQMPAFRDTLRPEEIAAVADYLSAPLAAPPVWDAAAIGATREMTTDYHAAPAPVFTADPMNITLVVETGDSHISVLDGDSLAVLDRFETPFAVHGGPKFSPDGRYVFVMSRDGWVQKYDIWSLHEVGRVRAGLNSRNIAMSADGKWLAVANYLPATLTILSTEDLSVARVIPVADRQGRPSRVSAVYQAPRRKTFLLALKDVPEIWEIATTEDGGPYSEGLVHSNENGMEEAMGVERGLFARRRIAVSAPLDDFFFDPDYRNLIGANREGETGVVVNLDVGREIASLPLPGMPHLGSGISWMRDGRRVMAVPHLNEGRISVIDMQDWHVVKVIETSGPGFFLRSHDGAPQIWADVFTGPHKGEMHLIDKQALEVVKVLKPEPGKTVAHTEFTRDGSKALVSVWEQEGAVIVYDSRTLQEITRLPMRKPSGKYNVWNKITFEDGTSH
ncbi:cbb3-type cytochrome c oxidase subunit III [Gemmobacter caeni]|uniref:Cbb3-type cytochrome c oxidase subunit III n=2 Tax=Gemmobacter caeni TaxID=589035 RepID=A0A2T6AWS7_9RHOB|nr:cbb3-type cytochrome c oxidase subunit III [Gemmobacter caeni]TWI96860.1 cbb3-type cytochrome c oxidase subunit III [Gemmobacter caeni]